MTRRMHIYDMFDERPVKASRGMLMPQNSLHQHGGKPPSPDLKVVPFPFGIVASVGLTRSNYLFPFAISFTICIELLITRDIGSILLVDKARRMTLKLFLWNNQTNLKFCLAERTAKITHA